MVECLLTAKKSKRNKKNKGKSDVQTERAATNDPVDEEEELSLDESKWSTPLHCYSKNKHQMAALTYTSCATLITLRPRENGRQISRNIFTSVFSNELLWIEKLQ